MSHRYHEINPFRVIQDTSASPWGPESPDQCLFHNTDQLTVHYPLLIAY